MSCNSNNADESDPKSRPSTEQTKSLGIGLEHLASGVAPFPAHPETSKKSSCSALTFKSKDLAIAKRQVVRTIGTIEAADKRLAKIATILSHMADIIAEIASIAPDDLDRQFLTVEYGGWAKEIILTVKVTSQDYPAAWSDNKLGNSESTSSALASNGLTAATAGNTITVDLGQVDLSSLATLFGDYSDVSNHDVSNHDALKSVERRSNQASGPAASGRSNMALTFEIPSVATVMSLPGGRENPDCQAGANKTPREEPIGIPVKVTAHQLDAFKQAQQTVREQRQQFSKFLSRLKDTEDYLSTYQENITAMRSTIADQKFATEAGETAKARILAAAATALHAQGTLLDRRTSGLAFRLVRLT